MKRIWHTRFFMEQVSNIWRDLLFDISVWFWIILLSTLRPDYFLPSISVIASLDGKLCCDNPEANGISFKIFLPFCLFSNYSRQSLYSLHPLLNSPSPSPPPFTSGDGSKWLFISTLRVSGTQFWILSIRSANIYSTPTTCQAVELPRWLRHSTCPLS